MPVPEWQWHPEKRFDPCILCTRDAVPDFLENILLFLPLGAVLAVRRYRLWYSVLFGGLLSLAIEIAQFVVPGRDPSLHDIICNTLGTFIGFRIAHSSLGPLLAQILGWCREIWEQWKRPTPTLSNVLVGGTHPITHKSSGREEGLFGSGDADGEGMELQESFPKGFGTGITIAFTSQEAPETCDHSDHNTQRRWRIRRRGTVCHDPGGLPFLGSESVDMDFSLSGVFQERLPSA